MVSIAKTFEECGFEKEFIDYLHSIGFKEPIGLQQQLIPLMVKQNYDIILNGGARSGKTIGYVLPIINQIIKNQKQSDYMICGRSPTGIILMNRPSLIKSVTQQINNLCQGLNIGVMSGNNKTLAIISTQGVDIIVTKVEILRKSIFSLGSSVSNVKYIVVDQANLYSKGEGKSALKEIYYYIQQYGNTDITSVFSSTDLRNEQHNLEYNFLGDNVKIINSLQPPMMVRNYGNNLLSPTANLHYKQMYRSNVPNYYNNSIVKKRTIPIPREYVPIHIFDCFKMILKIVLKIFEEDPRMNIVIFTRTSHIGQYLNHFLTQTKISTCYINESTNINDLSFNTMNHNLTGTTFIMSDGVHFTINCLIKNLIIIHQQIPTTKMMYERRLSMFNNNSTQIIKSIIVDSEEKLVTFEKCIS
uniref:ATP-dependent RNA helicase n=1 Tax=Strongyloides papillosus TaxID=174720 RepID=A0A0N5BVV0_STREA